MRRVIAATFVLSFGLWLANCSWFTKNPITPTVPDGGFSDASAGTVYEDCAASGLHTAWVNLLPSIETAMATGNIQAALLTEAATVGMPLAVAEFVCGVQYLVNKYLAEKPLYAADSLTATKIANGQRWLATRTEQPINVPAAQ